MSCCVPTTGLFRSAGDGRVRSGCTRGRGMGGALATNPRHGQHERGDFEGADDEDGEGDVCGICRIPFEGCCPTCKMPGDDCPLSTQLHATFFIPTIT